MKNLEEILNLQKIAFQVQAEIYNDYTIPPLIETLEDMKNIFPQQIFLKAIIDDIIVGSVRGYKEGETCIIGRLIVHPDFQNQGIGTKLMNEIEKYFQDIKRYELFTGHKSKKNIYLYKKLGYKEFKLEPINEKLTHIYFEKNIL
ncbi:MAG: GNAT family N-acetyltransferase [Candidatus Hodarchaeota archaeon]